jgi:hypothetical protein
MNKTLTEALKEIGDEEITININGQDFVCSRTEAVARRLYLLATGGFMVTQDENGDDITTYFKPTASAAKIIREYLEGRASQEPPKEGKKNSRAGSFDGSIAGRLNKLVDNGQTNPKT